jgi:hypothetical protein
MLLVHSGHCVIQAIVVGFLTASVAAAPREPKDENRPTQVSFQQDVIPILTQAGCNSGACHGTPSGKNGFRLSLRGYDPALDFQSLTRDSQGRRLNRVQPDASLILLKATGQVPHGGGRRFDRDSYLYALLRQWVAQGADDDAASAPRLARLEVVPPRCLLHERTTTPRLRIVAHYSNQSVRDVTHLTRFSVNDETMAQVTPDGQVGMRQKGEAAVTAEYLSQMATATVILVPTDPAFAWPNPPEQNDIDRHVFAKLRLLHIEPSPLASDEEFLRRAYLDVLGKLPSPEEARRFLGDTHPHKRDRLIDGLLERPEFADWWALKWSDRLGCNQRFVGKIGAIKYHQWIRHAMASDMPEDEFVRAILTGAGGNYGHPPASFWRRLRDPQTRGEEVAQLFLGVRLQCARCHNHPGERWTQDDYYGLAAFFARIQYKDGPFFLQIYDKEETVYPARQGEVNHPRSGQPVAPKFLGGPVAVISPHEDRREVLTHWLTSADNPFFARAAVNRIWFHLFGRGIVDPVDDLRSTNPPSNDELLAALTADFIRHGFDRKHLIRTIMKSRTYQLSSQTNSSNAEDEKYFAHARVRLLQAEQLLDAIGAATGSAEKFSGLPLGTPAVALPDGEFRHPFLAAFGRPARAMACACERDADTNLGQALQLIGGRLVQDKIHSDTGRVAQLIAAGQSNRAVVEELFLATLSRYPTEQERQALVQRLDSAPPKRRQVAEDILWALINHKEFLFQH